jgi:5'-nucleotidase
MIIYIDLDGTVRNIWTSYRQHAMTIAPDIIWPEQGPLQYWFLQSYMSHPRVNDLYALWGKSDIINSAEEYPGASDIVMKLARWHTVFLVTSPTVDTTCGVWTSTVDASYNWVAKTFGGYMAKHRLIFTPDRTTLRGDILIDDNPEIWGINMTHAVMAHIVFDQPYNQQLDAPRFSVWDDRVLELVETGV